MKRKDAISWDDYFMGLLIYLLCVQRIPPHKLALVSWMRIRKLLG